MVKILFETKHIGVLFKFIYFWVLRGREERRFFKDNFYYLKSFRKEQRDLLKVISFD